MADRKADRHPDTQTGVYARLDNTDLDRLDATRDRLGIRSRRQAIITAVREWLDRHDPEVLAAHRARSTSTDNEGENPK